MKTLKDLFLEIDTLQQVIDRETDDANSGSVRSQQLIINAEEEKEVIQDYIDSLGVNSILVI